MWYAIAFWLCALSVAFGLWSHNVGAATGWFVAFIAFAKLWATEKVEAKDDN